MRDNRIPPPDERLEFVRNNTSRAVHILCGGADRIASISAPPGAAEVIAHLVTAYRTLCGARTLVGEHDSDPWVWMGQEEFPDEALCRSCVQALGDQQNRAFHQDERGPW